MRRSILNNENDESNDIYFKDKLETAKNIYLELVYPYNREVIELPDDRALIWQTDCAIELWNLYGKENVTSYSENGLSESYGDLGLSKMLMNRLPPPKAGAIQ